MMVENKQKQKHLVVEDAQCISRDVREKIGAPIPHDEFLAQGGNPKGGNLIPQGTEDVTSKGASINKQESKAVKIGQQQPANKSPPPVNKPPEKKPAPLKQSTLVDKSPKSNQHLEVPKPTNKAPAARSASNPPIQKVNPPPKKAPVPSDYRYSLISSLFSGQEGWTILVRVINRTDLKRITTKKGE